MKKILMLLPLMLAACNGQQQAIKQADVPAQTSEPALIQPDVPADNVSSDIASKEISAESISGLSVSEKQISAEQRESASNFCYALQASAQCEDLSMRLDTEQKVVGHLGMPIRDKDSPLNDDCTKGLLKANQDQNLCQNAWRDFGCGGRVMPNLLQESPFRNKQAKLCQYS